MANFEISDTVAASVAALANELPINEAGASKKITFTQLLDLLQTLGMPRVRRLGSQHTIASATATKVTALDMTLETGTYNFRYYLICRSAGTGVGPQYGVNFSGTLTVTNFIMSWSDNTSAIGAEVHTMDAVGIKTAGFMSGMAHNAKSTTSPNMGTTIGVSATATDHLCFIDGSVIVTAGGDLQLYEGSEDTTQVTTEVGSSLVVIRTA